MKNKVPEGSAPEGERLRKEENMLSESVSVLSVKTR